MLIQQILDGIVRDLKNSWFDEYHKLVAKPTKVGEVAVYVQADL